MRVRATAHRCAPVRTAAHPSNRARRPALVGATGSTGAKHPVIIERRRGHIPDRIPKFEAQADSGFSSGAKVARGPEYGRGMGEPLNRRGLQRIAEGLVERLRVEPADQLLARYGDTPPPTQRAIDAITGQEFEYGVIAVEVRQGDVALAVFTTLTGAAEAELRSRSLWARLTGAPMGRSSASITRQTRVPPT